MAPRFFTLLTKKRKRKAKQRIKKKTHLSKGKQDRLSELPDPLISHILSFLEFKDAVQTSVLSKRLNLLWTQIDTINFINHFEPDINLRRKEGKKQVKNYLSSVYKTLTSISRIRNFSLTGFNGFHYCFPAHIVQEWVQYALLYKVETMNLDYRGIESEIPRSLFQCSSLTHLEMSNGVLDWDNQVNFPLLKRLSLREVYLGDEELEEILVGCPVLETLVLTEVIPVNRMCIVSTSLKKVEVDFKFEYRTLGHLLEIRAPLLEELEVLRFLDGILHFEPPVNLPLLKHLSLNGIFLSDGRLEEILLGCPVLESLVLTEVRRLNTMHIVSTSLKKVELVEVKYEGRNVDHFLEIRAPLLEELEILGYFMPRKCVFASLSSLVKARLVFYISPPIFMDDNGIVLERDDIRRIVLETEFNNDWIRMVEELLKAVCHVGDLIIGGTLLQVLTISMPSNPTLTFMCKEVRIVSPLWKYDLPGIVHLLESVPYLEALIVELYVPEAISLIDQVKEALFVNHVHMLSYTKGNFYHLKNIVIEIQGNPCLDCAHLFQIERKCLTFELVDYILRSCVDLERLMLCSLKACSNETKCLKQDCAFQYVSQLSSKLLTHSVPQSEHALCQLRKVDLNEREFILDHKFSKFTSMPFRDLCRLIEG